MFINAFCAHTNPGSDRDTGCGPIPAHRGEALEAAVHRDRARTVLASRRRHCLTAARVTTPAVTVFGTAFVNTRKQAHQLEELASRVLALLPAGSAELREDLRRNLRATLAGALARMDLVTQEQFEVQSAVLARTRSRLEALERRVQALEAALRERA